MVFCRCCSSQTGAQNDEEKSELINITKQTDENPIPSEGITERTWHPGKDAVGHESHEAKGRQVEWMNYMVRVMWPYMRSAIIQKAGEKFRDSMGKELEKHPEIKLTETKFEFDPGSRCPVVKHLVAYQRTQQERTGIQMDTDFSWQSGEGFKSALTIHGKAGPVPIQADKVGISAMEVSGTMSVLLSPLLPVDPCFGTGQVFFLDAPKMNMQMMRMKELGPVGNLLTKVIEGVVRNILQDGYILPNRYLHKVRKDLALETLVLMKSPPPLGVLLIHVLEGRNLKAAETSVMGTKSSDPFVEVKIGHGKARSSTVGGTLDPKWNDKPIAMFVYNVAQLVRITVYDDNVLGSEVLGMLVGYNVFLFCQATHGKTEGEWFEMTDPHDTKVKVGQLKLRAEYFDVADLQPDGQADDSTSREKAKEKPPTAPPCVLSVKLLGIEGEDRGDMRGTRCVVELKHPKESEHDLHHEEKEEQHAARLMETLTKAVESVQDKVKHATGLGFGHWEDGVPKLKKSTKAVLWGSQVNLQDSEHRSIPPMAVRAMEKLHMREGWPIAKIANMFALEPQVVRAAVEMRGNFEVVWHEALHFIQPADKPFHGTLRINVTAPKANQVRGADESGFIGEVELDLAEEAEKYNGSNQQRVRVMLSRPKAKPTTSSKNLLGEASVAKVPAGDEIERNATMGQIVGADREPSGILLEFVLEWRKLNYGPCNLDVGQTLRDSAHIIDATMSAGVHILPEP